MSDRAGSPTASRGRLAARRQRAALAIAVLAGLVRGIVVAWGSSRFPAVEDGRYYHQLASRLAAGAGYTWAWPDGVVTYAAHYPVGYPGILALAYRLLGAAPAVAMGVSALLGVAGVVALADVVRAGYGRRAGLVAGGLLALHPALVLYTPAVMTEGVTASLLCLAVWCAHRVRVAGRDRERTTGALVALGVVLGLATLVRPQSLLVAPVLGFVALRRAGGDAAVHTVGRRVLAAVASTAVCLAVVSPWTVRNCVRMKSCALVSVNGGWNLLIGIAKGSDGHWAPIDVPAGCRTVWDEAGKDACFGAEARRQITNEPGRFLALAPRKLAATFDYCGAAPWYLHASNKEAFGWDAKVRAGAIETVFVRLTLLAALVHAASVRGRARWIRWGVALVGAAFLLQVHASVAFVLLGLLLLARAPTRGNLAVGGGVAVLGTTALVHAAFFGAGRYSLVVLPFVAALAAAALTAAARARDTA